MSCRIPRFGAWGAVAGLVVGLLPFLLGSNSTGLPTWLLAVMIARPITLMSAASAAGSLALARRAEGPELLDAGKDVVEETS